MVEEARLESVYTPKGYRGFESLGLRKCEVAVSFYLIQPFYLIRMLEIISSNLPVDLKYTKGVEIGIFLYAS